MKLFSALAVFFAMAAFVIGAGGSGAGATYVDHGTLAAALAKGSQIAKSDHYIVNTNTRTKGATPEIHEKTTHIWYVLDGSATYVTGGTLIGGKPTKPGLTQGTDIQGGKTVTLSKGDVIVIPPGTPHWWKEVQKSITIYAINYME
jgi:quercetin dioxygenase-like cupin family protein